VQERLKIAKEFGDRSAERRAHSNLGNAHIFLGEFEKAAEHYKQTLLLAQVPYTEKKENKNFPHI
jgi:G-protein signaling modulator 2